MKRFLIFWLAVSILTTPIASAQDAPRPVKLLALSEEAPSYQRTFFGHVRARETVDLAFQVAGQIVEFPVKEGQRLKAGVLIAQLDLASFQQAYQEAEINLTKTRRDFERLGKLSGSNVSQTRIDDARTTYQLAGVAFARATRQLGNATLDAPFDALVARRDISNYTTVKVGTPVVRLHDMSELQVDIDIPEILVRRTASGDVRFFAAFPENPKQYPLEMREFEAEADDIAQTFRLTLSFVGETEGNILPGASTTVTITTSGEAKSDVIIPETALVFAADKSPQVMIFQPSFDDPGQGTVSLADVQIKVRDDGAIVLVKGPGAGTLVVSTGASLLDDGQSVRRFTGFGE